MTTPTSNGFGVDAQIGRTTTNTVQTAQKENELGEITAMESYGGLEEITEEDMGVTTFANAALNGQSGTTSAGIVTEHTLTETNTDYNRVSKKTVKPLAAGA
jgi:hypothetical protein